MTLPYENATSDERAQDATERPIVFLPRAEVERRVGLRRSAIYRRIRDKCFPLPVHDIDSTTVWWLESEIEEWQRERIVARDAGEHGAGDPTGEKETGEAA